ncbi:hypothetical protein UFOVP1623_38 [uncultured Caudovirales phage]|uniref:Uncharacterized protein n=1 Tax=uncultured Caudovirales phage TaxID=2100421 RepID=A0A6J5S3J9_9CAUD|nr:hypothetical protein UFOVP1376_25 [uncultured Caudovirales phage]CAB4220792.1 hypothetical protein UFOVP1623_38 [uncultured Caudovirales phage]
MITCEGAAPDWFHRVLQKINAAFLAIRPDNAVKITGGTIAGITTMQVGTLTVTTLATLPGGASLASTSAALTNGAGVGAGTLLTAPAAGNPTKWIGINDSGTIRYIPSW